MPVQRIKILVACCSTFSREGLKEMLSSEKEFVVVKGVSNEEDAIHYVNKKNPDIVLTCFKNLIESNNNFIEKIKERNRRLKCVVFDSPVSEKQESQLLKKGVSGILNFGCTSQTLIKALKKVYAGEVWLRRELIPSLITSPLDPECSENGKKPLTKREKEVLARIGIGHKNHEISSELCISEMTVKTHINSIYKKLNVNDRLQATFYAMNNNLLRK